MSADTDFDFSDVAEESEAAESNVLPRQPSTSRTGRSTGTRRGGRPAVKRLNTLKDNLSAQMFQMGMMTGMALPVTGYYIAQESDQFCDAMIKLASKKTEWIEALEQVANIGPGIIVGRTVLGTACALGVDRWHKTEGQSGVNPDKRAAMFLGVSAAYHAVYDREENASDTTVYVPPPGGTFAPIS